MRSWGFLRELLGGFGEVFGGLGAKVFRLKVLKESTWASVRGTRRLGFSARNYGFAHF